MEKLAGQGIREKKSMIFLIMKLRKTLKKLLTVMTMNMDKIIFEKNKNGTITAFKSHTISNVVLDELMPWNENFKK